MKNIGLPIFLKKFVTAHLLLLTVATASTNGSPEVSTYTQDNIDRPSTRVFHNAKQLSHHLRLYKFHKKSWEAYETDCNTEWKGPECIVKLPPFESNKVTFINSRPQPLIKKICITGYFFYEKFNVKLYFDYINIRDSAYQELRTKMGKNYRNFIRSKKPVILKNLDELNGILPLLYKHNLIPDHFIDVIVQLRVFNFHEFRS